jgi:hypothetical protein
MNFKMNKLKLYLFIGIFVVTMILPLKIVAIIGIIISILGIIKLLNMKRLNTS